MLVPQRNSAHGLLLLLLVAAVVGCSKGKTQWNDGRPPVFTAKGQVILDGQPVEKATVTFQPVDPEGRGGSAVTDAEGFFEAQTYEPGDGLTAGTHKVAIKKTLFVDKAGQVVTEIREPGSAVEKDFLPKKYGTFEKSGLTVEVADSDGNDLGQIVLEK